MYFPDVKILCISGSSSQGSSNTNLLHSLSQLYTTHDFLHCELHSLPLYLADEDHSQVRNQVSRFRQLVAESNAMIISTPEYLHNIPAVLKNGLEWLKTNGELQHKRVLAMTLTPAPPRGKKAMTSLLHSLQALEANVVGSLSLYTSDISFSNSGTLIQNESVELIREAIQLLS